MLDSNFVWSPAKGQWVAKSTPSSARPSSMGPAVSSQSKSPRSRQRGASSSNSARAANNNNSSGTVSQSLPSIGGQHLPSSATPSPPHRLHTASSAERGIFRIEDISQVGRVTQLFSESHKTKESTMNKTSSVNPPAPSSLGKGTRSTRNASRVESGLQALIEDIGIASVCCSVPLCEWLGTLPPPKIHVTWKKYATSEARTHDLGVMNPTRCRLRHGRTTMRYFKS
jgi:hypothetical protein